YFRPGSHDATLANNIIYDNAGGIQLQGGMRLQMASDVIGYDSVGTHLSNGNSSLSLTVATAETAVLKNVRTDVEPDNSGMLESGDHILSYNQSFATGTLRIFGNYTETASLN